MPDRQSDDLLTSDGLKRTKRGSGLGGLSLGKTLGAFVFMIGFLALLWAIQLANWADSYRLDTSFGIVPHSETHLADIFTAPFLHFSWQHLRGKLDPPARPRVPGGLPRYRQVHRGHGHRRDHERPGRVAVPVQQRADGRRERAHLRVLRLRGGARAVRPELRGRRRRSAGRDRLRLYPHGRHSRYTGGQLDRSRRRPGGRRAGGLDPAVPAAPGCYGRAGPSPRSRTARGLPCTKNSTTWACSRAGPESGLPAPVFRTWRGRVLRFLRKRRSHPAPAR